MKRHNLTLWLGIVSGQTLVYIFFILLSTNMTERSHFNLPIREKPTKSLDIEQYSNIKKKAESFRIRIKNAT